MKIGFVMVNYNDYENTKKMMDQVQSYSLLDQIVIVDNHSTDDSLPKIKKLANEKVVVLESDHNGGYGYGLNIGARYLNELYEDCIIIMSNTDIVIDCEQDVGALIDTFDEDTAVVAPMIREHTGYNCGWKIPSPWQDIILSLPGIYKKYQKKMNYTVEQVKDNIMEVEAVSGSFFLVKGTDLKIVDYFDEKLFLYYEENVLSKKLQRIDKKVVINGNVEVIHNHSVTIDKVHTSVQKYKNLKRSQYYFQVKYNHAGLFNRLMMKTLFTFFGFCLKIRATVNRHKKVI